MSLTREEMIYMSRIAEQTERFEDMLSYMKQVVNTGNELNVEERNLLSVAYKNSVGSRRLLFLNLELPGELCLPSNKKKNRKDLRIWNCWRNTRRKSKLNWTSSVKIFWLWSKTRFCWRAALLSRRCSSWKCKETIIDIFLNTLKMRSTTRRVWKRTQPTRRRLTSRKPT